MKKIVTFCLVFLLVGFGTSRVSALTTLFDWTFNVDGTIYVAGDTLPSYFDDSLFDWITGLGTLEVEFDPGVAGDHSLLAFLDYEIDEPDNTWFNEYGSTTGAPSAGQSWEIDEPGYVFGDIYSNVVVGALDNSNGVPAAAPDDVSMAMGWDFTLASDESAIITFLVSEIAPSSGFYLTQTDPDSDYSLYFSSSLETQGGTAPVPEPATIVLVGTGLVGLFGLGRKKFRS